jgi:hypothetical protein
MARKPRTEQTRTTISKEAFLEGLTEHGVISRTCKALGKSRTQVYEWMKDESFKEQVEAALRKGLMDRLYEAAFSNNHPAPLIFACKAILGLSDGTGEAKQLRMQLSETMRELEALRLAVYQATKNDPELQGRIFEAVEKIDPSKVT